MKIGVVGPEGDAPDDAGALRAALRSLLQGSLGGDGVEQVVFLGDGRFLDRALEGWAAELERDRETSFLDRALALAERGTAEEIHGLLGAEDLAVKLSAVRKMPAPPARAVELVDDRVVLFVHDKSVLDEEDIANASIIVYAKSPESVVKRFGKRAFATPGPLSGGRFLVIEPGSEGLVVSVVDVEGRTYVRETLGSTLGKMTVA